MIRAPTRGRGPHTDKLGGNSCKRRGADEVFRRSLRDGSAQTRRARGKKTGLHALVFLLPNLTAIALIFSASGQE